MAADPNLTVLPSALTGGGSFTTFVTTDQDPALTAIHGTGRALVGGDTWGMARSTRKPATDTSDEAWAGLMLWQGALGGLIDTADYALLGAAWGRVTDNIGRCYAFHGASSGTSVSAGSVAVSDDFGESWRHITTFSAGVGLANYMGALPRAVGDVLLTRALSSGKDQLIAAGYDGIYVTQNLTDPAASLGGFTRVALAGLTIAGLARDPNNPDIIYAAARGRVSGTSATGLYRLTINTSGVAGTPTLLGAAQWAPQECVAVNEAGTTAVYACGREGVRQFKNSNLLDVTGSLPTAASTSYDMTWASISAVNNGTSTDLRVVLVDNSDTFTGNKVWAGTINNSGTAVGWVPLDTADRIGRNVYGGVSGELFWVFQQEPELALGGLKFDASEVLNLPTGETWVAGRSGLWYLANTVNARWTLTTKGINASPSSAVAAHPDGTPKYAIADNTRCVQTTSDAAFVHQSLYHRPVPGNASCVTFDKNGGLYAAGGSTSPWIAYNPAPYDARVSTGGTAGWQTIASPSSTAQIIALAAFFEPGTNNRVILAVVGGDGLYRRSDKVASSDSFGNPATWTQVTGWTRVSAGVTGGAPKDAWLSFGTLTSSTAGFCYAVDPSGFYRSGDLGRTWTLVDGTLNTGLGNNPYGATPDRLFIATGATASTAAKTFRIANARTGTPPTKTRVDDGTLLPLASGLAVDPTVVTSGYERLWAFSEAGQLTVAGSDTPDPNTPPGWRLIYSNEFPTLGQLGAGTSYPEFSVMDNHILGSPTDTANSDLQKPTYKNNVQVEALAGASGGNALMCRIQQVTGVSWAPDGTWTMPRFILTGQNRKEQIVHIRTKTNQSLRTKFAVMLAAANGWVEGEIDWYELFGGTNTADPTDWASRQFTQGTVHYFPCGYTGDKDGDGLPDCHRQFINTFTKDFTAWQEIRVLWTPGRIRMQWRPDGSTDENAWVTWSDTNNITDATTRAQAIPDSQFYFSVGSALTGQRNAVHSAAWLAIDWIRIYEPDATSIGNTTVQTTTTTGQYSPHVYGVPLNETVASGTGARMGRADLEANHGKNFALVREYHDSIYENLSAEEVSLIARGTTVVTSHKFKGATGGSLLYVNRTNYLAQVNAIADFYCTGITWHDADQYMVEIFQHEPDATTAQKSGSDQGFIDTFQWYMDALRARCVHNGMPASFVGPTGRIRRGWNPTGYGFKPGSGAGTSRKVDTLYPGDNYVDVICTDPYNMADNDNTVVPPGLTTKGVTYNANAWKEMWTQVKDTTDWAESLGKTQPIIVCEWNCHEDLTIPAAQGGTRPSWNYAGLPGHTGNVNKKATTIQLYDDWVKTKPQVIATVLYNHSLVPGREDFRLDNNRWPQTFAKFKAVHLADGAGVTTHVVSKEPALYYSDDGGSSWSTPQGGAYFSSQLRQISGIAATAGTVMFSSQNGGTKTGVPGTTAYPDTTPPDPNPIVASATVNGTAVTLMWGVATDSESGLAGYHAWVATGTASGPTGTPTVFATLDVNTTQVSRDFAAYAGQDLWFGVTAFDAADAQTTGTDPSGEIGGGGTANETDLQSPLMHVLIGTTPGTKPNQPTDVTATYDPGRRAVDIQWDPASDSPDDFLVYVNGTLLKTVDPSNSLWTYLNPPYSALLNIEVSEIKAGVESDRSVVFQVQIPDDPATATPQPASNVNATATSDTQASVRWDPSPDATVMRVGYVVLRDTVEISRVQTNSFNDTGLQPSSSHEYDIEAYNLDNPLNVSAPTGQPATITTLVPGGFLPSVAVTATPVQGFAPLLVHGDVSKSTGWATLTINWGDGSIPDSFDVTTLPAGLIDHNYPNAGVYSGTLVGANEYGTAESDFTVTVIDAPAQFTDFMGLLLIQSGTRVAASRPLFNFNSVETDSWMNIVGLPFLRGFMRIGKGSVAMMTGTPGNRVLWEDATHVVYFPDTPTIGGLTSNGTTDLTPESIPDAATGLSGAVLCSATAPLGYVQTTDQGIPVTAGEPLTAIVQARMLNLTRTQHVEIAFWDADGTPLASVIGTGTTVNQAGAFTVLTASGNAPVGAVSAAVLIRGDDTDIADQFEISGIGLWGGTGSTSYNRPFIYSPYGGYPNGGAQVGDRIWGKDSDSTWRCTTPGAPGEAVWTLVSTGTGGTGPHTHTETETIAVFSFRGPLAAMLGKTVFRAPVGYTITGVRVTTANNVAGNAFNVDVLRNGSSIFASGSAPSIPVGSSTALVSGATAIPNSAIAANTDTLQAQITQGIPTANQATDDVATIWVYGTKTIT